jgi:CheY-like chemotaxis protein
MTEGSRTLPAQRADLAGALHEVSNALTVVMGWLDAARLQTNEDNVREALDVARSHADLGYRIARAAIGAEVSDGSERTAVVVGREAVRGVLQEAKRAGVRLVLADDGVVEGCLKDGTSALQILINLLLNAIAFSPFGGAVTLEVAYAPAAAVRTSRERHGEGTFRLATDCFAFRVFDEGPGVPPEIADTILQGPNSTRRGGAGIGLRYSAALAHRKGGSLRLLRPGPGGAFELLWPAGEVRSAARNRMQPVGLQGTRVVVVEDDPNVLSLVEFALDAHGIQVLSAATPDDVLDLLANGQTFDAALVDLSPFENREEVFVRLGASVRGSSIILISGMLRDVPQALEGRVAAWIRKPFEMGEVVDVLQQIVSRRDAGG